MSIGLKCICFQPYITKPWRYFSLGLHLSRCEEASPVRYLLQCSVLLGSSIFHQWRIITNSVFCQFFRLHASNLFVQGKCLTQSTCKSENHSLPARVASQGSLTLPTELYIQIPIRPTRKSTFNVQWLNIWNLSLFYSSLLLCYNKIL